MQQSRKRKHQSSTEEENSATLSQKRYKAAAKTRQAAWLPEKWEQVKLRLLTLSVRDGDHVIWRGKHKVEYGQHFPPNLTLFGVSHSLPLWWQLAVGNRTSDNRKGAWKSHCDVPGCFSCYSWQHVGLTSLLDMGPGDKLLALRCLEKGSRVTPTPPGNVLLHKPCREWISPNEDGKGRMTFLGKTQVASRVVWMLHHNRDILDGQWVRHRCRTTSCVEIEHLELGTPAENAADRVRDGTEVIGEKHPFASITNEDAKHVALSKLDGPASLAERAAKFGVTKAVVKNIDAGDSWKAVLREELTEEQKCALAARPRKTVAKRLSSDKVREVKRRLLAKMSPAQCARELGVSIGAVYAISSGKSYGHITLKAEEEHSVGGVLNAKHLARCRRRLRKNTTLVTTADGRVHWLWKGKCNHHGYGRASLHGKTTYAHRASFIAFKTDGARLPVHIQVRHIRCPFRNCINPDCLERGTAKDNANDRIIDGTSGRGEKSARAKIDEPTALAIKKSVGTGTVSERAARLGVTISTIRHIDKGASWGHLQADS